MNPGTIIINDFVLSSIGTDKLHRDKGLVVSLKLKPFFILTSSSKVFIMVHRLHLKEDKQSTKEGL